MLNYFHPIFSTPYLMFIHIALFLFSNSYAVDVPDTLWTRTFGGSNIDVGHCVQQTSDGGYVITGYTRSYGTITGRNIWLIKTDSLGNEIWNNTFGGNGDEEAYSVQQTSDGGFIFAGYTESFGAGQNDVILVKANSQGQELWKKTFGGTSDDEAFSVQCISGNRYIIAGVTSSFAVGGRDVWLIMTDSLGNKLWEKTHGGLSSDGARSIQQTIDGGFIITGWTFTHGPGYVGNLWIIKTDSLGNEVWNNWFGGADADRGLSVQQTSDSGYIVTGYTASSGAGLDDMLLIKYDNSGNEVWNKTFGGAGRDYGNSVVQTTDGGFIITGYTLSFGAGGDDIWIVKTDSLGIEEWNKTLGGTYSDVGYSIKETSDAGYILTGHTLSYGAGVHDVWLIKLTPPVPVELISFSGNASAADVELSWSTSSETNNFGFEIERTENTSSGNWTQAGFIKGTGTTTELKHYSFTDKNVSPGLFYYRLKQIDFNGNFEFSNVIEIAVKTPVMFELEQNYPNPFNPLTVINYSIAEKSFVRLSIYDALGKEITLLVSEEKYPGNYNIEFNAAGLTSGIYFYQLRTDQFVLTKKMMVIR